MREAIELRLEELARKFSKADYAPNSRDMMTEQEAEAWRIRLIRIWLSENNLVDSFWYRYKGGRLYFEAAISSDVQFGFLLGPTRDSHAVLENENHVFLRLRHHRDAPNLEFGFPTRQEANRLEELYSRLKQMSIDWLPFFRRGCWLSGCPIEATAHEKAEWIQGLSQEELQAWELKI